MGELRDGLMRSMSEPAKAPLRDIGWMNGWKETPYVYAECFRLNHKRQDIDRSNGRGTDHEVTCLDGCAYVAHYDSSD